MSFRYATSQVWLLDLSSEPHPSLYDLCPDHADALTVPRGWERVDQRSPLPPPDPEPAPEPAPAPSRPVASEGRSVPHTPDHRPTRPPNRYAALSADLPRLAAEVAATRDAAVTPVAGASAPPDGPAPAPGAAPSAGPSAGSSVRATAAPPHTGAPVLAGRGAPALPAGRGPAAPPRDAAQSLTWAASPEAAGLLVDTPPPELDGQLALDVDAFDDAVGDDGGRADAVVVPIGARRRSAASAAADSPEPVKP